MSGTANRASLAEKDFETLGLQGSPGKPAPMFRKEFQFTAVPSSALVTVHSPAYFELYVNGDFGGERLDARELVPEWSLPDLDTASWRPATAVDPHLAPGRTQPCPLNRIGKQIPAAAVTDLDDGRFEIDFGTALTGWFRLKMPVQPPGTTIRITFADLRPEVNRRGKTYQHFNQISEFVSAGKPGEVFENKFNYAGFRYVVIEGLRSPPAREDAEALLIESDLEEVGAFECSNELLNRIHRVNQWTQRTLNLGGYYVDCPHRERMGYGDGQVAAEGLMTSFRADGYYRKWLHDWRLRQQSDGNLPHMAPQGSGGGPAWRGCLSAVTWRHYLYYGDKRVLEENYDAVRRYVEHIESICDGGVPPRRGMDTNNWPMRKGRLYQGLAGIQADPAAPGFKNVIIRPAIVGDVTWVKAHHESRQRPGGGHVKGETALGEPGSSDNSNALAEAIGDSPIKFRSCSDERHRSRAQNLRVELFSC